jgi:hypothetical protein
MRGFYGVELRTAVGIARERYRMDVPTVQKPMNINAQVVGSGEPEK